MTKSKDTDTQPPMVFNLESVEVPEFKKPTGEAETTCIIELNESVTETLSDKTNRAKTDKPSKGEKFAKDTYYRAAEKYGKLIEETDRAREIVSVSLEDWRQVFYEMTSADNANTKRSQFKRARGLLLEELHLLFKKEINGQDYYCVEPSGDAYETGLILHIRRKNQESRYKD